MPLSSNQIAKVCHEANRAYCHSLNDFSHLSWEEAPDWQRKSVVLGVEAIKKNPLGHTLADSHKGWMALKTEEGWKYGQVKDVAKKEHPCMVPYDELPVDQQAKDRLFGAITRALLNLP